MLVFLCRNNMNTEEAIYNITYFGKGKMPVSLCVCKKMNKGFDAVLQPLGRADSSIVQLAFKRMRRQLVLLKFYQFRIDLKRCVFFDRESRLAVFNAGLRR